MMKILEQEILLEDYKLKVQYLVDLQTRAWNRFNYFLTLHTAISAGLFTLLASSNPPKAIPIIISFMGLVFALSWYIIAAQDRWLQEHNSRKLRYAQNQIEALKDQPNIGYVEDFEKLIGKIPTRIYQWRIAVISTTRFSVWFTLIITIYWLALTIFLLIFNS